MMKWFKLLSILGINSDLSRAEAKRIRAANVISLVLIVVTFIYAGVFALTGAARMAIFTIPIAMSFCLSIILNKFKCYGISKYLICLTLNCAVYIYSTSFGQMSGIHFWFIPAAQIPFMFFDLKNKRALLVPMITSAIVFLFLWMSDFGFNVLPVVKMTPFAVKIISGVMISFSFTAALSIVYFVVKDYHDISKLHAETVYLNEMNIWALNASSIVAFTDVSGKITHVNDKFCEISGYAVHELIGKTHSIVNSSYHSKGFFKEMWETISSKQVWEGEIQNKTKKGDIYWVQTTIVPMTNVEGKIEHYASIRHDITQRKAAEQASIQSARLASLGEVSGGIAHEINNPLAVIQGKSMQLLKLIRAGKFTEEKGIQQLDKVVSETERIAKIIRGLRSISRDGANDPFVPVEIKTIVTDVQSLCAERFKHHSVELKVEQPHDLSIECRSVQLAQVLSNLLNNSFDAVGSLPEKWVHVEFESTDDRVRISVTDSGKGIPSHISDKLMQPFFTTKEVGKGTGLGLSISRSIIEDHGGKLWLDRVSVNTRFIIELPTLQASRSKEAA